MAGITTDTLTGAENRVSYSEEATILSSFEAPIYTELLARGQKTKITALTHVWTERTLDTDRTIPEEGAAALPAGTDTGVDVENFVQTMEKTVQISGTAAAVGVNSFEADKERKLLELVRDNEHFILTGTKQAKGGAGVPRKMNGLLNMVGHTVDVIDSGGTGVGELTEDHIHNLFQNMYDAGARFPAYNVYCGSGVKRIINKLATKEGASISISAKEKNSLGIIVETLSTDFGTGNLMLNPWMPANQLLVVNLDMVEIAFLTEPFYEDLAPSGYGKKGHFINELTIALYNKNAGGKIVGIKK